MSPAVPGRHCLSFDPIDPHCIIYYDHRFNLLALFFLQCFIWLIIRSSFAWFCHLWASKSPWRWMKWLYGTLVYNNMLVNSTITSKYHSPHHPLRRLTISQPPQPAPCIQHATPPAKLRNKQTKNPPCFISLPFPSLPAASRVQT